MIGEQQKKLPKYRQIEEYYIAQIENGELNYGDKIPTEQELCDFFNTSRMTVNKAITRLVNKGYIRRVSGVGSFVTNRNLKKSLVQNTRSMTEDIILAGMKPGTELLEYRVMRGKEKRSIARKLELNDDDYMHYFVRLRTGDDVPLALSFSFISFKVLPEINVRSLEGSFNEYIQRLGIERSHCLAEFSAVMPTAEHKELLKVKDTALLKRALLWYTDETPFEYTVHYLLGNRFVITHSLDAVIQDEKEVKTYMTVRTDEE